MSGTSSFTVPVRSFRIADTLQGDTLQAVALRELGDASLWYDLVGLNNLLPPYLTDDASLVTARVLLAGATIKVPSSAVPATGVADADALYGTDIMMQSGRLSATATGDFALVSELPNLVQALENRLGTEKNELLYHPDYGFDGPRLIGLGASSAVNQLLAAKLAQCVASDPRVSACENTVATLAGDTITGSTDAITASGKSLPVGITPGPAASPPAPADLSWINNNADYDTGTFDNAEFSI
ncbi:MAG: hypothetical protein ACRYHQ_40500 [Janthinobacterium lividum]